MAPAAGNPIEALLRDLEAAMDKAETMKSPTGQSFGERLKAHKLPVPTE
jgi:hypothetical protein